MKLAKKICLSISVRRLFAILFFSLCFIFIGTGLKPAKAAETLSISNSGSVIGSINQNSAGGWAGQSFVAVDDNFSSVTWKVGTEYNDKYHDDFKLYLRNSSSETIASSTIHLDTPIQFTSGLEVNFALDTPYPTTPDVTYQFIIEISDEPFSYAVTANDYAGGSSLGGGNDIYFKIYTDSTPPSNDYVLYYGDNPVYTVYPERFDLPVVYNICDSWSSSSTYVVSLRNDSDLEIAEDVHELTSCSGSFVFTEYSSAVDVETAHFTISEVFGSDLVDSNEFLNVVYAEPDLDNNYILFYYPNPYYVDTSYTPPLSIEFAYNICDLDDWSDTYFGLTDYQFNSPFDDSQYVPEYCNDIATLELNYPLNGNYSLSGYIGLYDTSTDLLIRKSSDINIVFYSNVKVVSQTDKTSLFGMSAYDRACTTAEWAESESWLDTFPSSCSIKYGFWQTVGFLAHLLDESVTWSLKQIVNMFPLNIPTNVLRSWNNSETAVLSSALSPLDVVNDNNEITGTLPSGWFGTTTEVVILGKSTMTGGNNSDITALWVLVKALSVWLQWTLFALGFMLWAKSVYKDLSSETHNDKQYD